MTASVNDVHRALVPFIASWRELHERVRASFEELGRRHARVDPLWQDTMRKDYDKQWSELEATMDRFVHHVAPSLEEKLEQTRREVERFLYGQGRI
jgi:hypothetical protein